MKQWLTGIVAGGIFILHLSACNNESENALSMASETKNSEESHFAAATDSKASFDIKEKWTMPDALTEVSGIAYIDEDRFACVQDESGTVYIFNTAKQTIEKELPFAVAGDYEGIALVENAAYVVSSNGILYEIDDIRKNKPTVKKHITPLTEAYNIEGLCYDKGGNRLLLASKDGDPAGKPYKGIYAFDLGTKKLAEQPIYTIDISHQVFEKVKTKKEMNRINPSAMALHPTTGEIYITDGKEGNLLILDKEGGIKELIDLGNDFKQPEGITFSPEGTLYISNEGKKKDGNIVQLEMK